VWYEVPIGFFILVASSDVFPRFRVGLVDIKVYIFGNKQNTVLYYASVA